ncbi:MAG TPA: hypothetical protein VJ809_07125 [Pirellulales bacterium]|nr:hypothetical protein [Pirellulales bacterium]
MVYYLLRAIEDLEESMSALQPRYSKEEFARRGDEIYERDIRTKVEPAANGKFAAIDIETGAYEVDADEIAASDRLLARVPNAQTWLRRIGSNYTRRFGPRERSIGT